MINSNRGLVNIEGGEITVMADLACAVKAVQVDNVAKGIHPVRSAIRILRYVFIGLIYREEDEYR